MKTFKEYFGEAWTPPKGSSVGGDIKGVGKIHTSLKALYDLSLKFPVVNVNPVSIKEVITDFEDKEKEDMQVMVNGKIIRYADLDDKERVKVDQEEEDRIVNADYTKPIIIAGTREDPITVLDGNHRVAKALRDKIDKIPARFIPNEALNKFKK